MAKAYSPLAELAKEWAGCERCPLHHRTRKVHYRGTGIRSGRRLDVLFVGDGPGEEENRHQAPFVGKPGKLLDRIVSAAIDKAFDGEPPRKPRIGFCYLIACWPRVDDRTVPPPADSVHECSPRLRALIDICDPKTIVRVGSQAKTKLTNRFLFDEFGLSVESVYDMVHPAFMIRSVSMEKDESASVFTIADALSKTVPFPSR